MSNAILIASEPAHVFSALFNPKAVNAWWGCIVVTDARPGGVWVAGWGKGEHGLGFQTVLSAQISQFELPSRLGLKLGDAELVFTFAPVPTGTSVTIEQPGVDPAAAEQTLGTWRTALGSLKGWVEQAHPYTPSAPEPAPPAPVAEPAPVAPAIPTPAAADPAAGVQGAHGSDPYAAATGGGATVVDEGGFGVTDPNAVVKSWSKEQGFGYVTHAQLGDVSFDYDGCDFEPAVGDEVLLLVIGKRWDGQPKIKRIACPEKGSNIL